MEKQVKEPYLLGRLMTLILGVIILGLMIARIVIGSGAKVCEMLIFSLAAVMNFIGATISFSQQKRTKGNIYATVCACFLIVALILALIYFVF